MDTNMKNVVSMLVQEQKIMLFTAEGEVLDMKNDGPHDTAKIAEFLTPQITGTDIIPIDLNEYLTISTALETDYEDEGVMITTLIDGKEVQGIFYPQKVQVTVEVEGEKVVIPKGENLEKQAQRAADEKSPALRNFLRRLAPVVKDRLHSAEDLMDFIKKSEMPLTNDGRIIGYKRVNMKGKEYVDCHSGNITQNIGDRVWMDVDAVDPSRNNSCSHGLHVANLGYLSGFHGSHTLIVLVNPEDFIAVPHGEDTKCRVCSYDIVGVLTGASTKVANSGSHIEGDVTFENLISELVKGNVPVINRKIQVGTKKIIGIEVVNAPAEAPVKMEPTAPEAKPSGKSLNTDRTKQKKDIVKMARTSKAAASGNNLWDSAPAEVIAVFEDMRTSGMSKNGIASAHNTSTRTMGRWADKYDYDGYVAHKASNMTVAEQAMSLFQTWRSNATEATLGALVEFKKARKKGWKALGFNATQEKQIIKAMAAT